MAQRASDRKRMITDLEKAGDPLARDFEEASERTTAAVRMARDGGDYPLLSGGDVNLYSLFVERAMTLVRPDGMVGASHPVGHRLRQDGGAVLQGRGDRRQIEGSV